MSKQPPPPAGSLAAPRRKRQRVAAGWFLAGGSVVALVLLAGTLGLRHGVGPRVPPGLEVHAVRHERLQRSLTARGELEPAESSDIVCRAKAITSRSLYATSIKWVIDDGTPVRRGQVLVELDDSGYVEDLKERAVRLEEARVEWRAAEENCKIVASQNDSDILAAETAVTLAKLDLLKYRDGEQERMRKDIEGRLVLAQADRDMWQDWVAWMEHMLRRNYVTAAQARADEARLRNANAALDKLLEEMRVFKGYTSVRTRAELEGKLAAAKAALQSARAQALARAAQADADRLSKERIYQRRLQRYHEIEDLVRKCVIRAPHDGVVLHAVSPQSRSGTGAQQSVIAQGEGVREGQLLMRVTNLSRMQARVRIHEALAPRVRGDRWVPTGFGDCVRAALAAAPDTTTRLLSLAGYEEVQPAFRDREQRRVVHGQRALLRTSGDPDRAIHGHVERIATVASATDWGMGDNVYETVVAIDDHVHGLRPGMSVEVTIFEDETPTEVLAVPVEAVVREAGQGERFHCFVLTSDGPVERPIELGRHDEHLVEVRSGLSEGEEVVLNPRALRHEAHETGAD